MPRTIDTTGKTWTFGVEHELADWDTRKGFGVFKQDKKDFNITNSNGIASDATGRDYPFGAELNSPPTSTIEEQLEMFDDFIKLHPKCFVSHRVGMHVHIRVPGLSSNLHYLKKLQKYITENQEVYKLIDPLNHEGTCLHRRKWIQYLRRSHWTAVPKERVAKQLKATTVQEFLELEVPKDRNGKVMWHAQPRSSVNLRQLRETDTIEFRPFFQPLTSNYIKTAIEWCKYYLFWAFNAAGTATQLFHNYYENDSERVFPPMPEYVHWRQLRWEATAHNLNDRATSLANMKRIINGTFDDVPNKGYEHLAYEWKEEPNGRRARG